MVEMSTSGSGEGPGEVTTRAYSTRDPSGGGTDSVRSTSHGSMKQESSTFRPDMGIEG
jgi:hypothetical protein